MANARTEDLTHNDQASQRNPFNPDNSSKMFSTGMQGFTANNIID